VEELFPMEKEESVVSREAVYDKRSKVLQIGMYTPDLQNFRNTGWGAYQAVSAYVSNRKMDERPGWQDKKMERFMEGEPLLEKAQEILLSA
jgi:hypothetical protein